MRVQQGTDEKAVILLSGGVDSSTSLSKAIKDGFDLFPVLFRYGQKHSREIESSLRIAEHYGKAVKIIDVDLTQIGGSSLTSEMDIQDHDPEKIGDSIPSTYVPSRNIIFLSIAASYAETVGAHTLIYGANSIDYSGYPDCRPEFVNAMEKALKLGTKQGTENGFRIIVPLQYLTKGEIIRMGKSLHVPYQYTWSCYRGGKKACGKCDSCILRLRGFMEAGEVDPIEYEIYPAFYEEYLKNKNGGN